MRASRCWITRSHFRSLALATAIATVVLFAVGGLVRGTGSGLGCSTWPACEPGHLFPSGPVHSLIEFSHRAMAFLVIVLTALTGLVAIRVARPEPSRSGPRSSRSRWCWRKRGSAPSSSPRSSMPGG